MKDNLIQFPGTTGGNFDDEDDFCGAAGIMFEGSERPKMQQVYELEAAALNHINLMMNDSDMASIEYHGPEAMCEEFKDLLLEVLSRRKKEQLRSGNILTVSHPLMERDQQIPYLAERSELPSITVRKATREDLEAMYSLRESFPVLVDARNAIGSSKGKEELPHLF